MFDFEKSYITQLEERIKFRLKVEKTLGDISTYLVFTGNFQNAIEYFLSEIADLYHAYMVDGVLVFLFDEPRNNEITVYAWNSDGMIKNGIDFNDFPISKFFWFQDEIKNGHEIILYEEYDFPESALKEVEYIDQLGIEAMIAFPIFTLEYLAGALVLINVTSFPEWQSEDILTLRLFADILGTAIFKKKTEETLASSRDFLQKEVLRKTKDLETEKARIEIILNTIKDGVILLDEDGKVTMANDTARRFFRAIFHSDLIPGLNLVHSTGNIFYETIRNLFLNEISSEISIEPVKGLHLQFVSARRRLPGLTSLGAIIEFRDVTQYVEFDNMRKQFVSTVSHELRTPITVIHQSINNYEKYGSRLSDDVKQRLITSISRNAKLLQELIEDLLLISRIDERRVKFHWQSYHINDVIEEAIYQLDPRAKSKKITIETDLSSLSPLIGDPKRMAQILRILIDNSIKYSDIQAKITIKSIEGYKGRYNPNNEDGVLIMVIDTGMGIAEEDLPKLFERFYRSKRVYHISGTGLGLGIAKDLINLHKGQIFIESELNVGTTVFVFLPRFSEELILEQ